MFLWGISVICFASLWRICCIQYFSHRFADFGIPYCCVRHTAWQILVSHVAVFDTLFCRFWYPILLCSSHRLADIGIHATVFVTSFGRYWYSMLLYVSRYLGDFVTPRFLVGFALLCSIWKIIVCLLFFCHCLVYLLIYCFWYHPSPWYLQTFPVFGLKGCGILFYSLI